MRMICPEKFPDVVVALRWAFVTVATDGRVDFLPPRFILLYQVRFYQTGPGQ